MDFTRLAVQIVVAIICAGIGNILIPRKIPGGVVGLVVIGMVGVLLGDWGYEALRSQYTLNFPFLDWNVAGVRILPSVLGSTVVLYVSTALLKILRYGN